jgi:hypothetical protein
MPKGLLPPGRRPFGISAASLQEAARGGAQEALAQRAARSGRSSCGSAKTRRSSAAFTVSTSG